MQSSISVRPWIPMKGLPYGVPQGFPWPPVGIGPPTTNQYCAPVPGSDGEGLTEMHPVP
jgi:hypothetical protein